MWAYIFRRLLYCIPLYLCILLLMMLALRVRDPVFGRLSKNPSEEEIRQRREELGLDRPFLQQYGALLVDVATLSFDETSWDSPETVGEIMGRCVGPSLALTLPSLALTTVLSISVSLISAWYRGRWPDRLLVFLAVLGMSVSFLVYIIVGQYFGAYQLSEWTKDAFGFELFAIHGYVVNSDTGLWEYLTEVWPHYCLLPVLISVIVAMGYDTRFYRAVMVEESGRDYIVTATAKGASRPRIMFIHMLKNAMIPIITRIVITVPFLITGSFLLEQYFGIPGMGNQLLLSVDSGDFPVVQAFTAVFAAAYLLSNLATDILYALVDPRVRLS